MFRPCTKPETPKHSPYVRRGIVSGFEGGATEDHGLDNDDNDQNWNSQQQQTAAIRGARPGRRQGLEQPGRRLVRPGPTNEKDRQLNDEATSGDKEEIDIPIDTSELDVIMLNEPCKGKRRCVDRTNERRSR
jgi:hypothetical protein